jgi:tRNA nucleotidyltransferase/poly(A) polymerase
MNAIALDAYGNFIDYVGGIGDISDKVIRAVGIPEERFEEDPVRMMRAARFASMEGFYIELNTRLAIKKMFRSINNVTPERIGLELIKAAEKPGPQFAKIILTLDKLKILAQILPEVTAMKYFRHDLNHHPEGPTVFDHTIECLKVMEDHPYISKIAALLHDIGKCVSFQEDRYGWKLTYHRHERPSADMAADIMRKYKFSEWKVDAVDYAVRNHMKFHDLTDMKASKVARMVSNPHFPTLEDVAWADEFSRGETFAHYGDFDNKIKRAQDIGKKWEGRVVNSVIKIVDGRRIMKLLDIRPGPEVGRVKRAVEEEIIDNGLEPTKEVIDELILKHGG